MPKMTATLLRPRWPNPLGKKISVYPMDFKHQTLHSYSAFITFLRASSLGTSSNQNPFSGNKVNAFLNFIGTTVFEQDFKVHLANRWNSNTFVSNVANLFAMQSLGP